MARIAANVKRVSELFGSALTKAQRQELIAEELAMMDHAGKSAMRLVFKI